MPEFEGMDPSAIRGAARDLDTSAERLARSYETVRAAFVLADLPDSGGLLQRIDQRSETFTAVASELRSRADEVEGFQLEASFVPSSAKTNLFRGLASFTSLAELTDKIEGWDGPPDDESLTRLVEQRSEALRDSNVTLHGQEAIEALAADLGVSIEETEDWLAAMHRDQQRIALGRRLASEAPSNRTTVDVAALRELISADINASAETLDLLVGHLITRRGDMTAAVSDLRIDEAHDVIQTLLHLDPQSAWTPWTDGDANVTPADAMHVVAVLDQLTNDEANQVLDRLTLEERSRFDAGLEGASTDADVGWGHAAWRPFRWTANEVVGMGETAVNATVAFFAPVAQRFESITAMPGQSRPEHFGGPYASRDDTFQNIAAFATGTEAGLQELADGNIPLLSNYSGCLLGDVSSCLWLGGEVVLEVAGGYVLGRVLGVAKTAAGRVRVRILGKNGVETVDLVDGEIADEILDQLDDVTEQIWSASSHVDQVAGSKFVDDAIRAFEPPTGGYQHPVYQGAFLDEISPATNPKQDWLEGSSEITVRRTSPPTDITDIDLIDGGTLWEEKSVRVVTDPEGWADRHLERKVVRYIEARNHIPEYGNAPMGFSFTDPQLDEGLQAAILQEINRLQLEFPEITIKVRWAS